MWDGVPGSLLVNSQGSIMLDCFPVLPKPVIVVILELLTEKYTLNTWNNAYHSPIHSLPWSSKSPTYMKTSGSGELSEGAGGRNRRVHMLKPWLECLEPLAGPQAQGPWP